MKQESTLLQRLSLAADLPDEVFPGEPLVEILGQQRVLIEHHKGVTQYDSHQISVRVKFGQICVCGECLQLRQMTGSQLVISGRINSVGLIRGC